MLAGLLATVALTFGLQMGNPWTIGADLTMCAAAAATGRWTRTASLTVLLALTPYFTFPAEWVTFGEYGPLIPILGCSIRGLRRERNWVSAGALLVLTALQIHDYPGRGDLYLLGGIIWAVIIATLWLIGAGFAAAKEAQREAQRAALAHQRLVLARDLHDTVARTVARVSLQASLAKESDAVNGMDQAIKGLHQIGVELRWVMVLLRELDVNVASNLTPGSLKALTDLVQQSLATRGMPMTVVLDGDDATIPGELHLIVTKCLDEAAANVERHGKQGHPCALLATVTDDALDLILINECEGEGVGTSQGGLGLLGVRELLGQVGGQVTTEREGTQWILQMKVPLARDEFA